MHVVSKPCYSIPEQEIYSTLNGFIRYIFYLMERGGVPNKVAAECMLQIIDTLHDIGDQCILATLDAGSLYTNIPHDGGLLVVDHFLTLRQGRPNDMLSVSCIRELIETVLK